MKAEVLYGESDGVWLHLQREKRRSVEARVATLYSGKKPLGKNRYRLADKCSIVSLGLSGEAWQEHVLKTAHCYYDLGQTRLLITGGDGNQWVRRSFQRFDLPQEFVLDRFHLSRAAGRTDRACRLVEPLTTGSLPMKWSRDYVNKVSLLYARN